MKIISFAWTTPALLAGEKTCSRRDWGAEYAESFHEGECEQAWNKLPRAHGKRVATIQLTAKPVYSNEYPEEDYDNEGLQWMEDHGLTVNGVRPRVFWDRWVEEARYRWIIRFALTEVL